MSKSSFVLWYIIEVILDAPWDPPLLSRYWLHWYDGGFSCPEIWILPNILNICRVHYSNYMVIVLINNWHENDTIVQRPPMVIEPNSNKFINISHCGHSQLQMIKTVSHWGELNETNISVTLLQVFSFWSNTTRNNPSDSLQCPT